MSRSALIAPKWNPKECSLKEHKENLIGIQNKIAESLKRDVNKGRDLFNSRFEKTEFKDLNKKSKVFETCISQRQSSNVQLECEIPLVNLLKYKTFWIRNLKDWKQKGNSFETVLNSLINHLFCKYELPSFMYKLWYTDAKFNNHNFKLNLFILLTRGESLYKIAKLNGDSFLVEDSNDEISGETATPICEILDLPYIPLFTKKQCHLFLSYGKHITFQEAIVKAQIESLPNAEKLGNCNRFLKAVFSNQHYKETVTYKFSRIYMENFKLDCIQWLSNQIMLDYNQIPPILDYLYHMGNTQRLNSESEGGKYSLKGRTINSVMESMKIWHEETLKAKASASEWKASAIKNYRKEKETDCSFNIFKIEEILNLKELQKEGNEMRHCVASYANSLITGTKSIWSLTKNNKKVLTIEVVNSTREIVQIAGKCNIRAEKEDLIYIKEWARVEDLRLGKYCT